MSHVDSGSPPLTPYALTGIQKGAGESAAGKIGTITEAQLKEIAEIKMPDLNAITVEAAMKIVGGTARNMGTLLASPLPLPPPPFLSTSQHSAPLPRLLACPKQ